MPTKEAQLTALAAAVRRFIDQEIPDVATWNINPDVLADALALIATDFTDSDTQIETLRTLFEVDHDSAGKNNPPLEWVPDDTTPLFLNGAQFSLSGDRRADYAVGYRVLATLGSSPVIVAILAVTYSPSPTNRTTLTVASAVSATPLTSALTAIARSLVRVSAPRVLSADLMPGAVDATALADGAVATAKIGAAQVTTAKLADSAVTSAKLGDLQVTTAKLGPAAVDAGKLAGAAVTTAAIETNAVTSDKIATAAVVPRTIGAGAVSNVKLAPSAVTADKIAPQAFAAQAFTNLVRNGSFEAWPPGVGAPLFWTLDAGATAVADAGSVQYGVRAAAITATIIGRSLHQTVLQIGPAENTALRGTRVAVSCLARAAVAGAGRLRVFDGVTETASTLAGGEAPGARSSLSVVHALDANATQLTIYLEVFVLGMPVLFDGVCCARGSLALAFSAHPGDAGVAAVEYQDHTTNRVLAGVTMQSGWSFVTIPGSNQPDILEAAVVFPRAFASILGVSVTLVGFKANADPTSVTDTEPWPDVVATEQNLPVLAVQGGTLRPAGMTVLAVSNDATSFSAPSGLYGRRYVFSWSAWGIMA